MIEPGDIFERKDGRKTERVVVYRVREPNHANQSAAVFYDKLGSHANNGATIGPGAIGRFIAQWGQPAAKMTFKGAYKLFLNERKKRRAVEEALAKLKASIHELA